MFLQKLLHERAKSNNYYMFRIMFVASGTQREMCKRHIVIRGLPVSIIFFHVITIFGKQEAIDHKMCVLIFFTNLLKNSL
jgi:hypothetical protein